MIGNYVNDNFVVENSSYYYNNTKASPLKSTVLSQHKRAGSVMSQRPNNLKTST